MNETSSSNKRLAKNTLYLYMRMLVTVGISFYSTRLILSSLGVSDYGIYNVIGGMVSMFYMVTSTLSNAISRFLTIELGKNDEKRLKEVFVTSTNILILFSTLIILLAQTLGLWFLNTKLNIDPTRMVAANWIYQFTIIAFVLEMLCIPFNSLIIAHERMKAFALMQIADVIFKLGIALSLAYISWDKLIYYGLLMMIVAIMRDSLYIVYCKKNFVECIYKKVLELKLFKEILKFTGWLSLSVSCMLLATSGVNIVLNLFYGTVLNATQGVATQIKNAAGAFSKNFMIALVPQITKSVSQQDYLNTESLVYRGAKYSYFLIFFIAAPLLLETDYLLSFWLKEVPPFATIFVRLTIMAQLVDVLFQTTWNLNNAIGEIKHFQITYAVISVMNLPFSYLCLYTGMQPYSILIVGLVLNITLFIPCFKINCRYVKMSVGAFLKNVILKVSIISLLTIMSGFLVKRCMEESILRVVITTITTLTSFFVTTFLWGMDSDERAFALNIIKKKLNLK